MGAPVRCVIESLDELQQELKSAQCRRRTPFHPTKRQKDGCPGHQIAPSVVERQGNLGRLGGRQAAKAQVGPKEVIIDGDTPWDHGLG